MPLLNGSTNVGHAICFPIEPKSLLQKGQNYRKNTEIYTRAIL